LSIVEARVMGLPVLVTEDPNLGTMVEQVQAGWCVPSTPHGVSPGLQQALGCHFLVERSEAATRLARAKLTPETIPADLAQGAGAALNRQRGRT
jgi:hypothetical protein